MYTGKLRKMQLSKNTQRQNVNPLLIHDQKMKLDNKIKLKIKK